MYSEFLASLGYVRPTHCIALSSLSSGLEGHTTPSGPALEALASVTHPGCGLPSYLSFLSQDALHVGNLNCRKSQLDSEVHPVQAKFLPA